MRGLTRYCSLQWQSVQNCSTVRYGDRDSPPPLHRLLYRQKADQQDTRSLRYTLYWPIACNSIYHLNPLLHCTCVEYSTAVMNMCLILTQSVSGVWQLFWHSVPFSPGFALEQLKKTIGSEQADDSDKSECLVLFIFSFAAEGILLYNEMTAWYLPLFFELPWHLNFPLWQELKENTEERRNECCY